MYVAMVADMADDMADDIADDMKICDDMASDDNISPHLWMGLVYIRPLLMAIISQFDRQLLRNKLSFTSYSIHILLISNKCNKFWLSCDCRCSYAKNQTKWAKYPGRPATPRLAGLAPLHIAPCL